MGVGSEDALGRIRPRVPPADYRARAPGRRRANEDTENIDEKLEAGAPDCQCNQRSTQSLYATFGSRTLGACRIFPGFSSLTFDGPWQNGSVKQARGKSNRVDTVQSGWVEFCSQEACYHQKGDNPPGDDHADSNYLWVTCQERT